MSRRSLFEEVARTIRTVSREVWGALLLPAIIASVAFLGFRAVEGKGNATWLAFVGLLSLVGVTVAAVALTLLWKILPHPFKGREEWELDIYVEPNKSVMHLVHNSRKHAGYPQKTRAKCRVIDPRGRTVWSTVSPAGVADLLQFTYPAEFPQAPPDFWVAGDYEVTAYLENHRGRWNECAHHKRAVRLDTSAKQ